jgi:hypothetical protein
MTLSTHLPDQEKEEAAQPPALDSEVLAGIKKLMVIHSDLYVRNYIQSGILSTLIDENFYFIASQDLKLKADLEALPNFLGYYQYSKAETQRNQFFANVWLRRYKDRSSTFQFRCHRLDVKLQEKFSQATLSTTKTFQRIRRLLNWLPSPSLADAAAFPLARLLRLFSLSSSDRQTFLSALFGSPVLAKLYTWFFEAFTRPNAQLEDHIRKIGPDVVMFPFQALDEPGLDLVRLQKKFPFKTLYMIENWDNLSSKTVFRYKPDYLTVWGQQSVEHAVSIHEFPVERIFKIGTPRFQAYYEALALADQGGPLPPSPYPFKYILFAGYSWAFDEITALHMLDEVLDRLQGQTPEPLKIVYRPHPWRFKRSCPDMFYPEDFKHVVLDEQLKDIYYNPVRGSYYQPDLAYYPRLLLNAEMAVGGLTSLMIELAICRKKLLVLGYDDGIHLTNPANAMKHNKHYEHIETVPGLEFVWDSQKLAPAFEAMLRSDRSLMNWDEQREKVRYYHYDDELTYPERLRQVLRKVVQADSA